MFPGGGRCTVLPGRRPDDRGGPAAGGRRRDDELLAVVCDQRLPDGDGLDLAVDVAAALGDRVTVAVMSGHLGKGLADRAEAAGLQAFDKRDMARVVDLVPGPRVLGDVG